MKISFCYVCFFVLAFVSLVESLNRGDCSFSTEGNLCGYEIPKFGWRWSNYDINFDHTGDEEGRGGYLIIRASNVRANNKTRVSTPNLFPTEDFSNCLTFWYRLSGYGVKTLRIYVDKEEYNGVGEVIWETTELTGDRWKFGQVQIMQSTPYIITFEMEEYNEYMRNKFYCYAALDDIAFTSGHCSSINENGIKN